MSDPASLEICETFVSIQGESSFAGLACFFLRLAGCPLDCAWCDTLYAKEPGQRISLASLIDRAASIGVKLVEVTGGEPLAQPGAPALLTKLCDAGHTVLLETSGAMSLAPVDERVHIIMDIKPPSSNMQDRMLWENLDLLKPSDEIKLAVADRADYDYAREIISRHDLASRCHLLLSTVEGRVSPQEVVEWMLADRLPVRFQLQMHKYIWPPDTRGV